eukprot:scaffold64635_cov66-Phaeocystis_antarctica.AAC.3
MSVGSDSAAKWRDARESGVFKTDESGKLGLGETGSTKIDGLKAPPVVVGKRSKRYPQSSGSTRSPLWLTEVCRMACLVPSTASGTASRSTSSAAPFLPRQDLCARMRK